MKKRLSALLAVIMSICLLIGPLEALAYPTDSAVMGTSITGVNWMSSIDDSTYLSDLSIPGTHDSGARITDSIATTWAKCQNLTITAQLNAGVRYLDMRLAYDTACKGNIRVVHGSIDCWNGNGGKLTLYEVINECYAFLAANPTETVIMSVKQDAGDNASALANAIWALINENRSKWYVGSATPRMQNVRSQIVLASRLGEMGAGLNLNWGDQGSDGTSVEINSSLEVQDRYNMGTSPKWSNAVKPMLDKEKPSGKWFLNFLSTTGAGTSGVVACSNNMSDAFYLYEMKNNKCYGIVIFDMIVDSLAKRVYQCNDRVTKTQVNESAGQYYYRVNINTTVRNQSFINASLRLYYRTNRGKGSEGSVLLFDGGTGPANGMRCVNYLGNYDFSGIVNGFPTQLVFSYQYPSGQRYAATFKLQVSTSTKKEMKQLGTWNFDKSTDTDSTNVYNVAASDYPTPSDIKFNNGSTVALTVPKKGQADVTKTISAGVYDQYGTLWDSNVTDFSLSGNYQGITLSGNTITVNYTAGNLVPNNGTTLDQYVKAKYVKDNVTVEVNYGLLLKVTIPKIQYEFLDYDDTVLEVNWAYAGRMPAYYNGFPERAPDSEYHYFFDSWTNATGLSIDNYVYKAKYTAIAHTFKDTVVAGTPNEQGYTKHYCNCGYYEEYDKTGYGSDMSALTAALNKAIAYNSDDYSGESLDALKEACRKYANIQQGELPQTSIDKAVTEILTKMNQLVPYFTFDVEANNGTYTVSHNDTTGKDGHLLQGTTVTLTATPNSGYYFDGWFDKNSRRVISSQKTCTVVITANTDLEARFIILDSATLTFYNDSEQEQARINLSAAEWSKITDLTPYIPPVPAKLGYTNGRWALDQNAALSELRFGFAGRVNIYPQYDAIDSVYPDAPTPTDTAPAIELNYIYNEASTTGSFILGVGLPSGCTVKGAGVAFKHGAASTFNPVEYPLELNNKSMVSTFNTVTQSGLYVVHMSNLTGAMNYAAIGYLSYLDADGNLVTITTDQVNIVNTQKV